MRVRFATAGALLCMVLGGASCEEEGSHVKPAVGTLIGVVNPAGAAARIKATDEAQRTYVVLPDASGAFELRNVPNGSYQLTIEPTAEYTEPVLERCTVRYATSNLDTVTMLPAVPTALGNTLAYSIGAEAYRFGSVTAALSGRQLLLTAVRNAPHALPDAEQMFIQLTDFTGPGTYECGSTATIVYQQRDNGAAVPYRWSTAAPEGRGTVRITYHDPVARTVAGVFSFEAGAANSVTSGKFNTTNGYFAAVTY
ncbi:carboxypeptidase-like regulatory domain-containing protein [Hymenobacter sp. 15J16-1T3B]|uniref:carboxypeptidase-like regulatory domain-containing protein n=1 Tax=Hymenobacter sp. 15J16-1T3B TaxID=2886941 RepID=UPI001D11079B|nr:carboxypeptidase-like regulatory domain-containing protein [Hymenobacter sp. 15J16-1T3B]MCC3160601.1 carboxypeptidase-like regulatory domain-containing protein [Hymenobacter sp. 15J16-1T3B]